MIKSVFLIGFCSLGFMVTAHAANIDLPGGDAMVSDTAYESYSYNSVDMDLVEAQFRRHSGPVVAQTVKNGRRTVEQAKAYMDGNAKFLKRQANQSTVFIFDDGTQHIRFSMPYPSLESKAINDNTNSVVNVVNGIPQYYIKSMNADIVVDVDDKTTYTDRAFTYKTVKNGQWQQKYGIMTRISGKEEKADYEPTSYGEETRVYKGGDIVQLIKRRPIFSNDEKHFYSGAFSTMDTMSRKYPYSVNDNAIIWRNGMPAFSGSVKFDNGINYTYFTIRDDKYVYSIEVAYKANMVKTSYHDIRNMVEMAKLINHPHKQAFPALEYLWEADVFKLP